MAPVSRILSYLVLFLTAAGAAVHLRGQSVTPIISEYTGTADGFFEVSNRSMVPQIVLLEPKSFSIESDGTGRFRPLDSNIHLDLSATSVRLEAQQTARVFYKVRSDAAPAWLCIYAVFTAAKKSSGINVRVMLPHTIYIYQKESFPRSAVRVLTARYNEVQHRVVCDIENTSGMAVRAEQVEINGTHNASTQQGGFPLLPDLKRTLSIEWTDAQRPRELVIHFPKFDVKTPVETARE